MQRTRAVTCDLDVIDVSIVPDLKLEDCVHLVAVRTLVALEQHCTGPRLDDDEGANEHRGGCGAGTDVYEMKRPHQRGPCSDVNQRPVSHEGGVEGDREIIGRHDL